MKKLIYLSVFAAGLVLAACGPSPEEQATMTAAAWTATPRPTNTPTATPIPYDVEVSVVDVDGHPIEGVLLSAPESGDDEAMALDASGKVAWLNFPSGNLTLSAKAQGYFPTESSHILERGQNSLELVLERDPYGVLPSEACPASETLAFLEDFQDNSSPNFEAIEFGTGGWGLGEYPDEVGNLVGFNSTPEIHPFTPLADVQLDHGVWRFSFAKNGDIAIDFNFIETTDYEDESGAHVDHSRYMLIYSDPTGFVEVRREQQPVSGLRATAANHKMEDNTWHLMEFSRFDGRVEVWIDGEFVTAYDDRRPLPAGGVSYEIFDTYAETVTYYDNITVCTLSEPFVSAYVAPGATEE